MSALPDYETVIGLEVHCQLATCSKLFSAAPTSYGAPPNTQVGAVEIGLPGALPVLNRRAVTLAMRAGLALGCQVMARSHFDRKHYTYPDLPKGYQITQRAHPICLGGQLALPRSERVIRLERVHLEEDAGKSSHLRDAPCSLVDFNRAGVPLIEVVTRPDLRSPEEAVAFLKALHQLVVYLGVCDGNMEQGSLRCDANVSVKPAGRAELGVRCEIKNINSFKFVRDAIAAEARRQRALIASGGVIVSQTRRYDPDCDRTFAMRDKEHAPDYRYLPEPDLPALVIDPAWREQVRRDLPELPAARRARYARELGLSAYDAAELVATRQLADYFEGVCAAGAPPKLAANWVLNELLRHVSPQTPLAALRVTPERLGALIGLITQGVISGKIAKQVFEQMFSCDDPPEAIVTREGLAQICDTEALGALIDEVLAAHPDQAQAYRDGKVALRGFFVGQVMKASCGKAHPERVNALLSQRLS